MEQDAPKQLNFSIYQRFNISTEDSAVLDFEDLMLMELKGENLMAFQNDWEMVLSGILDPPHPRILESLSEADQRGNLHEGTAGLIRARGCSWPGTQELRPLVSACDRSARAFFEAKGA